MGNTSQHPACSLYYAEPVHSAGENGCIAEGGCGIYGSAERQGRRTDFWPFAAGIPTLYPQWGGIVFAEKPLSYLAAGRSGRDTV